MLNFAESKCATCGLWRIFLQVRKLTHVLEATKWEKNMFDIAATKMAEVDKTTKKKTIALPFLYHGCKKSGKIMGHRLMVYGHIGMGNNIGAQEI